MVLIRPHYRWRMKSPSNPLSPSRGSSSSEVTFFVADPRGECLVLYYYCSLRFVYFLRSTTNPARRCLYTLCTPTTRARPRRYILLTACLLQINPSQHHHQWVSIQKNLSVGSRHSSFLLASWRTDSRQGTPHTEGSILSLKRHWRVKTTYLWLIPLERQPTHTSFIK